MDTATATPAQIDTEIHRLDTERQRLGMLLINLKRELGEAENQALGYGANRRVRPVAELRAEVGAIGKQLVRLGDLAAPLGEEWIRRNGWTRWYLVTDGHLHYDMAAWRCSRIPTTEHYWMTEFSGKTADEMIELAGTRVCTACFPGAPVDPRPATARFMTPSEAERAAYREQAARVRAVKKAAQITTPEGTELRAANGVHGDLIKTEIAARRRALQDASDIAFYGDSHPSAPEWRETVDRMIAALVHRTGTDEGTLRTEIRNKITKKARREQWTIHAQI